MKFGSLFAGIGGFDLGLERAGMECKWQVEIDERKRAVLARHWPDVARFGDIAEVSASQLGQVDLIAGGFPCTDISSAGDRAGIDGEHSGLWTHFARLIRELRPRYVLVENVPALLVRGMETVLGDLAASGYDAEWDCLPAAAFGAPHLRARLWLLAYPAGFGDGLPEGRVYAGRQSVEHDPRWASEPGVRGVDDGTADRVDRLRVLGNGVVAPIAERIGRAVRELVT